MCEVDVLGGCSGGKGWITSEALINNLAADMDRTLHYEMMMYLPYFAKQNIDQSYATARIRIHRYLFHWSEYYDSILILN